MSPDELRNVILTSCAREFSVEEREGGRFIVWTPFTFPDGDHIFLVVRHQAGELKISDDGHVMMHLAYDSHLDRLTGGPRGAMIDEAAKRHLIVTDDGAYSVQTTPTDLGAALMRFCQFVLSVVDVSRWNRKRVSSTFFHDWTQLFKSIVPDGVAAFGWHHPEKDPPGKYRADLRIETPRVPIMVFALGNDDQVRLAQIALMTYKNWSMPFESLGIYENQVEINRNDVARLSDVIGKQFSHLAGNESAIKEHVLAAMS